MKLYIILHQYSTTMATILLNCSYLEERKWNMTNYCPFSHDLAHTLNILTLVLCEIFVLTRLFLKQFLYKQKCKFLFKFYFLQHFTIYKPHALCISFLTSIIHIIKNVFFPLSSTELFYNVMIIFLNTLNIQISSIY